jgi:hypothetical protein
MGRRRPWKAAVDGSTSSSASEGGRKAEIRGVKELEREGKVSCSVVRGFWDESRTRERKEGRLGISRLSLSSESGYERRTNKKSDLDVTEAQSGEPSEPAS